MVEKNEATKERIRKKDEKRRTLVQQQLDERMKSHMELRLRQKEKATNDLLTQDKRRTANGNMFPPRQAKTQHQTTRPKIDENAEDLLENSKKEPEINMTPTQEVPNEDLDHLDANDMDNDADDFSDDSFQTMHININES